MMETISADDHAYALLEGTGQYKVLRRLPPIRGQRDVEGPTQAALILDTETTGLDTATAKIIEIALLPVYYNSALEIVDVGIPYTALQDPGEPLSEEVRRVTGLTDEMLKGQSIDWEIADTMIAVSNIDVAHNAAFDRPLIERYCPSAAKKAWACTANEIPWKADGFPSTALWAIAYHLGYFFDAHRAMGDVNALASILALTKFKTLIESARRTHYRVFATGSPFGEKDRLKARGYKWDDKGRVWYFDVTDNTCGLDEMPPLDLELNWLRMNAACPRASFKELTARERYK